MINLKNAKQFSNSLNATMAKQTVRHMSDSSGRWLQRHVNDEFVKKSRYENYRARSAFKLIQIDEKFNIIRPGHLVIDLGASPGSWSQVAARLMKLNNEPSKLKIKSHTKEDLKNSLVIAVDILPINPIEGVVTIGNVDFTKPLNQAKIISLLKDRKADLVMSDMAPNASGMKGIDIPSIVKLAESSLKFSLHTLKPGTGVFLTKLWAGNEINEFEEMAKKHFDKVRFIRPPATRGDSTEVFLLCQEFKGI